MRLGILTDVHSNTEALAAVMGELREASLDALIHLGDVIGYGAEPNECCAVLRRETQLSLLGNHDAAVVGRMDRAWFASHARAAVEWTDGVLEPGHREWLKGAPYTYREGEYFFCHGSPVDPPRFRYVMGYHDAEEIFQWAAAQRIRVTLVGHAHQCIAFRQGDARPHVVDGTDEDRTFLDVSSGNWVINVGSAGQPRDGDPRACYAILDLTVGLYEARRVAYDFTATGDKIRAAELPAVLSARLALGR